MNTLKHNLMNEKILSIPLAAAPGAKILGVSLQDMLSDARTQAEGILRLADEVHPDGVVTLMDVTVEASAFGGSIIYSPDGVATLQEPIISSPQDVKHLDADNVKDAEKPRVFAETVRRLKRETSLPVLAYAGGPLTVAGQLLGLQNLMMVFLENPEFAEQLLEFTTKVSTAYSTMLAEEGADAIIFLEPSCSMLSKPLFEHFLIPYFARLPEFDTIIRGVHVCGTSNHLIPSMNSLDIELVSLDYPIDLPEAAEILAPEIMIIGNINPVQVKNEEADTLHEKALSLVESMQPYPGRYILSSGCDISRDTPLENIKAITSAIPRSSKVSEKA